MSVTLVENTNEYKELIHSSMYAQYLKERLPNKHILESDKGFATYIFLQDAVYVEDVFILPEHRFTKEASKFGDQIAEIAREKGLNKMYGSVKPSAIGSTESMKFLFSYGFKLLEAGLDSIVVVKEI